MNGGQYFEGFRDVAPESEKLDHPHPKMSDRGEKEKEEQPKRKRRERTKPLEGELELSGEFPREICGDLV